MQEMPAEAGAAVPEAPLPSQPAAVAAEAPTEPTAEPAAPTEPATPTEPAAAAEPPAPAPELTDEQRAMLDAFKAIDADGDGELRRRGRGDVGGLRAVVAEPDAASLLPLL